MVTALVALALWASAQSQPMTAGLDSEIARINATSFVRATDRPVVVVTGSSSVRLWQDPESTFPGTQVVNTGFGGSTMADLAVHLQELVIRFQPDLVVIHEGDNDLAEGRTVRQILGATGTVLERTEAALPDTRIVLVSAKPSPSRWSNAEQYRQLNAGYRSLARRSPTALDVRYADMWPALLGPGDIPDPALYESDGLHLNQAGYLEWDQVLSQGRYRAPDTVAGPNH